MFLLTNRNVFHLLAIATFLHICQARRFESSEANTADRSLWQPKEGTRDEWMACRGMPKDVCERIKIKKQELQKILAKKFGINYNANDSSLKDSGVDQCIMFTEEQLDMLIAEAKNEEKATSTRRRKRTLMDFEKYRFSSKWSIPIPYMFDGTHNDTQKETIRDAFKHWTDNTCIRFSELPMRAPFHNNYILMTKDESDGCWSYVGDINGKPQPMNLASWCVDVFGTILHEIGHSLGLFHEQERSDRNNSIKIIWNNTKMGSWSQYMEEETDALGLPYNYGSVMHYPSKSGNSVNGGNTMYALQSLYRMNMGQRSDLSFHDRKIINLAYCNESCATPLSQPCQRSGYQNPDNCATCICPDGFSGQYCNGIAPPKNSNCGGILNIVSGTQVIKSPGFDDRGYSEQQECTWWIKAPKDYKLELAFNGSFSIYCRGSACFHWVEIKYKKDLGLEGARFCCDRRPSDIVVSESNEMMVIFRSNYSTGLQGNTRQRGFQAVVKSTPNGNRKSLFRCSFENTPSGDSLCGMTQDKTDQFDWTVYHDPTPSHATGPDFPYDGYFYIYIEASSSEPNDEARLFFPRLYFYGEVCVNFYYHMFGQDVKTLKLVRINLYPRYQTTVIWTKIGQSGDSWLQASVGVNLAGCSQLQFIGIRGDEYAGDIGLDKIEVTSGPCTF